MTATAIQEVTTEDVKQAIIALFKGNKAELKVFLDDFSSKIVDTPTPKKRKMKAKKQKESTITFVESPHIPYSEMPFWKANPHLKPIDLKAQGYGVTIDALKNLQIFFQKPGNEITDEWFEMLD